MDQLNVTAGAPPAGFRPFEDFQGFIGLTGPYYWREDGAGVVDYGFRADERHGKALLAAARGKILVKLLDDDAAAFGPSGTALLGG